LKHDTTLTVQYGFTENFMYRHLLVPIDCSDDSRRLMVTLARFATPHIPCKVTLVASVTPTDDEGLRKARLNHALTALHGLHDILHQYGVWSRTRVLESEDHIGAISEEATDTREQYDLLVLGTHQTRIEDWDAPCQSSFADRLSQRSHLPVMVLPSQFSPCPQPKM
jgi:nucleotide-binding universal stress UspA family protein